MSFPLATIEITGTKGALHAISIGEILSYSDNAYRHPAHIGALEEIIRKATPFHADYVQYSLGHEPRPVHYRRSDFRFDDLGYPKRPEFAYVKANFDTQHGETFAELLVHGLSMEDIRELGWPHGKKVDLHYYAEKFGGRLGTENLTHVIALAATYVAELDHVYDGLRKNYWDALDRYYKWRKLRDSYDGLHAGLEFWRQTHNNLRDRLYLIDRLDSTLEMRVLFTSEELREKLGGAHPAQNIAIFLLGRVRDTLAGRYNPGGVLMMAIAADEPAPVHALLDELVQYRDAGSMYNTSVQRGVTFHGRRIPDELTAEFEAGWLDGTKATYSDIARAVSVLLPPLASAKATHMVEQFCSLAHELRHGGRHYGDAQSRARLLRALPETDEDICQFIE